MVAIVFSKRPDSTGSMLESDRGEYVGKRQKHQAGRDTAVAALLIQAGPRIMSGAGFGQAASPSTSLCYAQDERGAGGLRLAPVFTEVALCQARGRLFLRGDDGRLHSSVICSSPLPTTRLRHFVMPLQTPLFGHLTDRSFFLSATSHSCVASLTSSQESVPRPWITSVPFPG